MWRQWQRVYAPESCGMLGVCACRLVVEADGSVYPCDFYVDDAHRLGNVQEQSLRALYESEAVRSFVMESTCIPDKCRSCRWFGLCRGGCRRYREWESGLNTLCAGYMQFFEARGERLLALAQRL